MVSETIQSDFGERLVLHQRSLWRRHTCVFLRTKGGSKFGPEPQSLAFSPYDYAVVRETAITLIRLTTG